MEPVLSFNQKGNCKQQQQAKKQQNKKQMKTAAQEIEEINWVEISQQQRSEERESKNFLGLWHRPKLQHLQLLKKEKNLDYVITVQGQREQSLQIQKECKEAGLNWINIPLEGANMRLLSAQDVRQAMIDQLKYIIDIIQQNQFKNQTFLIHCAAGIHRTGITGYSLLRYLGYDESQSMNMVKQMRDVTYLQVGEHRIKFAEDYVVQPILQGLSLQQFDKQNPLDIEKYQKPKQQIQESQDFKKQVELNYKQL